ncbi:MAG: hypothetical protein LBT54_01375 [Bifidobacteriaceae bacterium]|nr:hypothetical protein [Bifidobacteriaceae bacterium]
MDLERALADIVGDQSAWVGQTAGEFRTRAGQLKWQVKKAMDAAEATAKHLVAYADALEEAQKAAANIRESAITAGLPVSQFAVQAPDENLAMPLEEWQTGFPYYYQQCLGLHDDNQAKWAAFEQANRDVAGVVFELAIAAKTLADKNAKLAEWIVPVLELALESGAAAGNRIAQTNKHQTINRLLALSRGRAAAANPPRRIGDPETSRLRVVAEAVESAPASRLAKAGKLAGRTVGLGFAAYGVHSDMRAGESAGQAVVSQGVGLGAGIAAGAAVGSVIPVAGTVAGAVVGGLAAAAAGVAASLLADEAVDGVRSDGPLVPEVQRPAPKQFPPPP